MKALVFIPLLVMGLNIGGLAQTTINLPAAQNCAPAGAADTDNDGIPDSRDACPSVAGVWALKGCPVPTGTTSSGLYWECDHAGTAIVDVTLSDGSVWMDRNMGALRAATGDIDLLAGGCTYQYGRKPDGHQRTQYYQPPNWMNGYPTAGNIMALESGVIYDFNNGFSINPQVGQESIVDGAKGQYSVVQSATTSPVRTYNQGYNTTGSLYLQTPYVDNSPNGMRFYSPNGLGSSFPGRPWWQADNPTYPVDSVVRFWGGNGFVTTNTFNTIAKYDALTLVQPWGTETNPVCPVGYHVPTASEWYSALTSISVTDAWTNTWGKSKLKLVIPFGNGVPHDAYWTSTVSSAAGNKITTINIVPNNVATDLDGVAMGILNIQTGAAAVTIAEAELIANLYVRCKKN